MPPSVDLVVRRSGQAGDYRQCTEWQAGLGPALEQEDPDVVLLSSASYSTTGAEAMAAGLRARVEWIDDELGALPVLVRDVPRAPFDVPACLSDHPDDVPACAFPRAEGLASSGTGHDALAAQLRSLPVIDLTDAVCPARTCSPIVGGVVVWRDSNHLSATYVRSLRGVVEQELLPLVRAADLRERARGGLDRGGALGS
ncbi:SGNH hydrolase domain-containing protein [Ornithinimicrobium flavum]|uniref:SGNH hydrolase domain-containing protein n=1 Tax=Ornithinimicrobium flavum TaxID=1288636 RepID=UPI00106FDB1C|nr:SGNH hydrolase domain-containing protein [Ornithinimicrobium flavum]